MQSKGDDSSLDPYELWLLEVAFTITVLFDFRTHLDHLDHLDQGRKEYGRRNCNHIGRRPSIG